MSSSSPTMASRTRSSIKEHFPLGTVMSTGSNNPITLHSVDDELFAGMWSFIAETLVVTRDLPRATKEAIAALVSERNECPVCIKAHCMMEICATKVDDHNDDTQHAQALNYAELLIYEVNAQRATCVDLSGRVNLKAKPEGIDTSCWNGQLSEGAKAEVALVVALFMHVNRVVSAIMGEEMSTAMMNVPRGAAKVLERIGAVKAMSRAISPFLANTFRAQQDEGFTNHLFDSDSTDEKVQLPKGLQNLMLAGHERARAVSRLVQWVAYYESDLMLEGDVFDYDMVRFIDEKTRSCNIRDDLESPKAALIWVEGVVGRAMDEIHQGESGEPVEDCKMALTTVLILVSLAPKAIFQSEPWKILVKRWGEKTARSIVVFWSLRTTLKEAHILFSGVNGSGSNAFEEDKTEATVEASDHAQCE